VRPAIRRVGGLPTRCYTAPFRTGAGAPPGPEVGIEYLHPASTRRVQYLLERPIVPRTSRPTPGIPCEARPSVSLPRAAPDAQGIALSPAGRRPSAGATTPTSPVTPSPVFHEEDRRAIESIKLRAPIEEVVRERVPALRKRGALWEACCPFHDEKTPSFKVDPRRGTWRCFGACGTGGDQFAFLQRVDNLGFREVLEILAARTGVELPKRRGAEARAEREQADEPLYKALEFAQRFFVAQLAGGEGRASAEYLARRGLSAATAQAFGAGHAPAAGQALVGAAREAGLTQGDLEAAGLARTNDSGRSYDFFRGRLTIPIRDVQGRVVGFGARRLVDDDAAGPKYVNTSETRLFHKGRLVYALDRAQPVVRKLGHIVLMEGYTDVMAAHQAGLTQCVAVLGTATTEEHAGLIRKSGARRITLLFDGDEAGRKAAWKALSGLVHLDTAIDVVSLEGGEDPCDLLVREGAAPLLGRFELATDWFQFVCGGLDGLRGAELARAVDPVLELIALVKRPVQRESLVQDLARRIGISVGALREQWRMAHGGRPARPDAHVGTNAPSAARPGATASAADLRAHEDLLGALLLDASLIPLARPERELVLDPELALIFDALLTLYADESATPDEQGVLALLGEHPARDRVVPLADRAREAESPRELLEGQLRFLAQRRFAEEVRTLELRLAEQERLAAGASGEAARAAHELAEQLTRRLTETLRQRGQLATT